MKKGTLINSEISHLVARLGHGDAVTICDAGLPVPPGVPRIDLAVCRGLPTSGAVHAMGTIGHSAVLRGRFSSRMTRAATPG